MTTANEAVPADETGTGDNTAGGPAVDGTEPDDMSEAQIAAAVDALLEQVASIPEDHSDAGMAAWIAAEVMAGKFCRNEVDGWLRYATDKGIWVRMDDRRMVGIVSRALVNSGDAIWAASKGQNEEARARARSTAAKLSTAKKAKDVLSLLVNWMHIDAGAFEQHMHLLCVGNGVVDLRDGSLGKWSPDLYMLKRTPVLYKPGAWQTSKVFKAALSAVPDEVADGLQARFGQAAYGEPSPDDEVNFMLGGGSNGKSTVLIGARRALGKYADVLPHKLLLGEQNGHDTVYMPLRGLRLGVIEELPDDGHYMSAVNIKRLTQEEIKARYMRQDYITFLSTCSLFVSSNYDPRVKEVDHGTWRRLKGWPFRKKFVEPAKAKDGDLVKDTSVRTRVNTDPEVHAAFLSWIVQGAVDYWKRGRVLPALPKEVEEYTAVWRQKNDVVVGFLDEYAVLCPGCVTTSADLFDAFNEYVERRGMRPFTEKTFAEKFGAHESILKAGVEKARWQSKKAPEGLTPFERSTAPFKQGNTTVWHGVCLTEGNEYKVLRLRIEAVDPDALDLL